MILTILGYVWPNIYKSIFSFLSVWAFCTGYDSYLVRVDNIPSRMCLYNLELVYGMFWRAKVLQLIFNVILEKAYLINQLISFCHVSNI